MNKRKNIAGGLKSVVAVLGHIVIFLFRLALGILSLVPWIIKYIFESLSKRLRFSITFKTTSIYTIVFFTMLLLLNTILIGAFGYFLLFETKYFLEKSAALILSEMDTNSGLPAGRLKEYADMEDVDITLLNQQGNIIYSTSLADTNTINAEKYPVTIAGESGAAPTVWVDSNLYLHLAVHAGLNNEISYLTVSKSLARQKGYLILLMVFLFIFSLLAIIMTVIIGSRTSKKMLKPIDNMTRTARSISAGALHTRLDVVRSHDELKELAETFNEMLDRIQAAYEQQNRFVSDASHELRTPISVIQGYANLLKRWGKEDKEVLEEGINAINNEAEHMRDLVEKLLYLARGEQDTRTIEKSSFSMDELVNEVLKETSIVDPEHTIKNAVNERIIVNADRKLLKQALRIFIDNSIKYTPPGGSIRIDSHLSGNRVILTVEDTGVGIPAEELPYIFDRFYRCDKARTRKSGGTGLGLAIAKWIIEKHQGTIKVESTPAKGTKVAVTLPLQ